MKTGRNLQEVLVELNRQNKAKQDFISPAQGMRLREDGHTFEINHLTTSQQEVFGTTSLFHRQVASALGIPAKYYDLMQAQKPELLAENVNSWFADKPSSYMVRSMGRVPDGLAAQAVQQAQVGTQDLSVQSGPHPEPHHPLYRGDADAEAASLPHRSPVRHPEQDPLRSVCGRQAARPLAQAAETHPLRHHPS